MASVRSKYSNISRFNNAKRTETGNADLAVVGGQTDNLIETDLLDQDGKPIKLTRQQMALLEHLAGMSKKADLTSKQREFLENITLDDLKGMEEEQIGAILD